MKKILTAVIPGVMLAVTATAANDGMALLGEDLINKPDSPWNQVDWK